MPQDSDFWAKVLDYLSKFIIPAVLLGMVYAHASIQKNDNNIVHLQKNLDRVSTEHNGRIQSNRVATRENGSRVSILEAMLPQILEHVKDLKIENRDGRKYQKEIVEALGKLDKSVAVLRDRDERKPKE